ncbi:MAG: haloacid dehalogenase-like hydrolase, partial [Pseudomonadota bacterium]|nr:haloacid dehalogenase-like hydrolase [Pseudomonadota bacterium]
ATDLEVVDGILTGRMDGGNCVRQEKARRVRAFLEQHGPFDETWGYGNRPHDIPMLDLLDHRIIV